MRDLWIKIKALCRFLTAAQRVVRSRATQAKHVPGAAAGLVIPVPYFTPYTQKMGQKSCQGRPQAPLGRERDKNTFPGVAVGRNRQKMGRGWDGMGRHGDADRLFSVPSHSRPTFGNGGAGEGVAACGRRGLQLFCSCYRNSDLTFPCSGALLRPR